MRPGIAAFFTFIVTTAFCADQPSRLSFEVASIKRSNIPSGGGGGGGVSSAPRIVPGCNVPDPARVRCTGVTVKKLLQQAYSLQSYQVEGPDWLEKETYDIDAKIPEGLSPTQVPLMFQSLLADRFGVLMHRETRPMQTYEVTVGKNGLKLTEVEPVEPDAPGAVRVTLGYSSRSYAGKMTIDRLAQLLTRYLHEPVFDHTGLTATYDIQITYAPDDTDPLQQAMHRVDRGSPSGNDPPTATLPQAMQALGLKMEAKKGPVEVLVIDKANKTPVENQLL